MHIYQCHINAILGLTLWIGVGLAGCSGESEGEQPSAVQDAAPDRDGTTPSGDGGDAQAETCEVGSETLPDLDLIFDCYDCNFCNNESFEGAAVVESANPSETVFLLPGGERITLFSDVALPSLTLGDQVWLVVDFREVVSSASYSKDWQLSVRASEKGPLLMAAANTNEQLVDLMGVPLSLSAVCSEIGFDDCSQKDDVETVYSALTIDADTPITMTSGTSAQVEAAGIVYDVVLERAQPAGPRGFCQDDGPAPRAFLFFAVANDATKVLSAVERAPADMVPTCVPDEGAENEVRAEVLVSMDHYAGTLIRVAADPGHARWALPGTDEAVLDIAFQHELAPWATDIGQQVWADLYSNHEGSDYWLSTVLRTASDGALLMGQYIAYTAPAKQPFEDTSLGSLGFAAEPHCTYYTASCECGAPPSMEIRLFDVVSPGGDARVPAGGRGTFALEGRDYTLSVAEAKEDERCGPDELRALTLDLVVYTMQ